MQQPLTPDDPTAGDAPDPGSSLAGVSPQDGLGRAAARLERAVASLEAMLGRPAPADPASADPALQQTLQAALEREGELQEAAAVASRALGRAMAEVRLALQADEAASEQGLLDLALETAPQSLEDEAGKDEAVEDGAVTPGKEPAA